MTVKTSDQIWADPSLTTRPSYPDALATGYGAGLAQAPLLHDPDRAAQEISQAVATATGGQIPQLLPPGSLSDTGWVLTDALYLHAAWAAPFQASQTQPAPFTTAAGRQVSVPFMNGGQFHVTSAASAADFTGLSPQACCIALVRHAATLQVGEQGTVANPAAA